MSKYHNLSIATILVSAISISATAGFLGLLQAQEAETFSAILSGNEEIPPTQSGATGWAKFQTDDNGTQVLYSVNLTGLNEITGAHIHNGSAGQNGDIVVSLSGQQVAENGNNTTISLKGNITQDDMQGPLEGKELSELVSLMSDGIVYVNVHTGEYQNGEIRGQIVSGLPESEINVTSTTSNNTIPN
jgi:CHRD domain-containing protein